MVKFLTRLFSFGLISILSAYSILYLEDGNADAFGMRFTTGKKSSLIIGNSRSAHGLIPDIIEAQLTEISKAYNIYNYSFGIGYSAYGPVYLNSILDKLDTSSNDGIFIVAVDPWAIVEKNEFEGNEKQFPENNSPLRDVKNSNYKPNIKYMLSWFSSPYYEIIHRKFRPANERLHRVNGWLEVVLPMDFSTVNYRRKEAVKKIDSGYKNVKFSSKRFDYLDKTIDTLSYYGDVFLIYVPAHPKVMIYDSLIVPDFNVLMKSLSEKHNVPFKDYSEKSGDYNYTEGIHLHQSSSMVLSEDLGNWISKYFNGSN